MGEWQAIVVPALVGAAVAALGALIQSLLSAREKIDESLREERVRQYRVLWEKTGLLPLWPRAEHVTYARLSRMSTDFRDWYFHGGGLFLSTRARKAYGKAQEAIAAVLEAQGGDRDAALSAPDYDALQQRLSALRTELTGDLLSRRRALGAWR